MVGVNHGKITAFMDNIRQKFAVKLGRAASEFWGVEIHPGKFNRFKINENISGKI